MSKRQSAKYKLDRRMGENIWGRPKSPVNRREYGPGQHGQRRKGKMSDFGIQLRAKQKLKEDSTKFSNNLVMQQLIGSGPHLREGSPAQNAERIQVPVLMVAGGLGHDSTIDQTRVMHGALSTAGKKVELIEYPGVAQDLDDSDVRAEMLRRIAQFLPH